MTTPLEQRLQGSWKELRGRIRQTWGSVTDDDLERAKGKLETLIGRIEARTGESRDKIRRKLEKLAS